MSDDFSIELHRSSGCSLEMRYRPWHTVSYYPVELRVSRRTALGRTDLLQPRGHLGIYPAGPAESTQWLGNCEAIHLHIAPQSVRSEHGQIVPKRSDPCCDTDLRSLMASLYEECRGRTPGDRHAVAGLVENIRQVLSRIGEAACEPQKLGAMRLCDVLLRMQGPAGIGVRLTELAGACLVSRSYFSRRFSAMFGCSPHDYLLNTKVEFAKNRIYEGEASLADIAISSRFYDQSHLSRQFRRRTGMTPGEYRRHFAR